MTDKEFKKLKRGDLLEVLLEQSRSIDDLKIQLQEKDDRIAFLNKKLEERKIDIQEAGTIAEASFKLNGVFEAPFSYGTGSIFSFSCHGLRSSPKNCCKKPQTTSAAWACISVVT